MSSYITSFSETLQARGFKWYTYGEFLAQNIQSAFLHDSANKSCSRPSPDWQLKRNTFHSLHTFNSYHYPHLFPYSYHSYITFLWADLFNIMWNGVPQKLSTPGSCGIFTHIFLWYYDMLFNKNDHCCAFYSVDICIFTFDSLLKCDDDMNSRIIL